MIYIAAAVLLLLFVTVAYFGILSVEGGRENYPNATDISMTSGWTQDNGSFAMESSATHNYIVLTTFSGNTVSISHRVDKEVLESSYIRFRSDCGGLRLYRNGELIYERAGEKTNDILRARYIPVPELEIGDVLRLELTGEQFSAITVDGICCGTVAAIRSYLMDYGIGSLILTSCCGAGILILLIAFIAFSFSRIYRWEYLRRMLLCAFGGAFYLFSSEIGAFTVRSPVFCYLMTYSSAFTLPIVFFARFRRYPSTRRLRMLFPLLTELAMFAAALLLHFLGVFSLRRSASYAMLLSTMFEVIQTVWFYRGGKKYPVLWKVEYTLLCLVKLTALLILNVDPAGRFMLHIKIAPAVTAVLFLISVIREGSLLLHRNTALEAEKALTDSRLSLAQINTHFFFNTINTIRGLIPEDADTAYKMTGDLGRYLRYRTQSEGEQNDVTTFKEELRAIRAYADICTVRMNGRLTVLYDIETDDFELPTLTVEPFVENAIRHGVFESEHGTVHIRVYTCEQGYRIQVEDDGVGFDTEKIGADSLGISNVRRRLSAYQNCALTIDSAPDCGTAVTLTIPFRLRRIRYEAYFGR